MKTSTTTIATVLTILLAAGMAVPVIASERPRNRRPDLTAQAASARDVARARLRVEEHRTPLRGVSGAVLGHVIVFRDVTERAEREGISVEVFDCRSLNPLDVEGIAASVEKTGRAVVAHEDKVFGGFGGEIAATIGKLCFESLDAPVAEEGTVSHLDMVSDPKPTQEEMLGEREERKLLTGVIEEASEKLDEKERYILDHRLLSDEPQFVTGSPGQFGRNTPGQQLDVEIPPGHKSITLRVKGTDSEAAWANAGFIK